MSNTKVQGSILRKIVASELVQERERCNFDKQELYEQAWMTNKEWRDSFDWYIKDRDSTPELQLSHEFFDMTPQEKQLVWMKKLNFLYNRSEESK